MSAEDRLTRALGAPAAPAKDMRFTLEVMRKAEAARFRAETGRRLLHGAAIAGLAVAALAPLGVWAGDNADTALDLALSAGGAVAMLSLLRALRRPRPAWR